MKKLETIEWCEMWVEGAEAKSFPRLLDFLARVENRPEYYSEDAVHFNPAGVASLAHQVVECVRANV